MKNLNLKLYDFNSNNKNNWNHNNYFQNKTNNYFLDIK